MQYVCGLKGLDDKYCVRYIGWYWDGADGHKRGQGSGLNWLIRLLKIICIPLSKLPFCLFAIPSLLELRISVLSFFFPISPGDIIILLLIIPIFMIPRGPRLNTLALLLCWNHGRHQMIPFLHLSYLRISLVRVPWRPLELCMALFLAKTKAVHESWSVDS